MNMICDNLNGVMEHQFWHEKWETGDTPFHEDDFHPFLNRHWPSLGVAPGSKVFVPLCGKSRDMLWLLEQGYEVLGAELSELAAQSFFDENGLAVQRSEAGSFVRYRSERAQILCGDFFSLTPALLDGVAAVYDRAALIALSPELRARYAAKMKTLLPVDTRLLLITITCQNGQISGPPFRVFNEEVRSLYGPWCDVELLEEASADVKGHICPEFAHQLQVR